MLNREFISIVSVVGWVTLASSCCFGAVSLQDGIYQEEIEGDLDAAIAVYQELAVDESVEEFVGAQAMYRMGMCYLKRQDEAQAKSTFQELLVRYPDQTKIVERVHTLLKGLISPDPASLMPPDTLFYVELGSPGKQIETILNMLRGTPLANPLAALGPSGPGQQPKDVVAALLNPSMVAEFKKVRGVAVGIMGIEGRNGPPMIAVLYPGKSDALRGLILAGLGVAGAPGDPLEEMSTVYIGNNVAVAHDDDAIIISQPPDRLAWAVRQYKGVTDEPTLASSNEAFARIGKKKRKENALTAWVDADNIFGALKQQFGGRLPQEIRLADGFVDFGGIDDVLTQLSLQENGWDLSADVRFKDGHNCLAFDLLRTPAFSNTGFEAVPPNAIALVSLALNPADDSLTDLAGEKLSRFTGLDILRGFSNLEQATLFVVPPTEATSQHPLAKVASPVLPCLGLALTSHNPAKTHQLWQRILGATDRAMVTMNNAAVVEQQSGPTERFTVLVDNGITLNCYLSREHKSTILSLSPEVNDGALDAVSQKRSALMEGALSKSLGNLPPDTGKLVMVNYGGAVQMIGAHLCKDIDLEKDPNNPLPQLFAQLAGICESTTMQLQSKDSPNSFQVRLSVKDLPPLADTFPVLMQLTQAMQRHRPRPIRIAQQAPRTGPQRTTGGVNLFSLPYEWQFKKDPGDIGLTQQWFTSGPDSTWGRIRTDRSWRQQTEGRNYYGVAWYGIDFQIPPTTAQLKEFSDDNGRLLLRFAAVDGFADIYLDGKKIGEQKQNLDYMWDQPFTIALPPDFDPAAPHTLMVRVKKDIYAAGIWQRVSIIYQPKSNGSVYDFPITWRFKKDPQDRGLSDKWYAAPIDSTWDPILTTMPWTNQGHDYYGAAWYSVDFQVDPANVAQTGRLALEFGAVDGHADVYLDGNKIGEQKQNLDYMWDKPFTIPLPVDFDPTARHTLAVRVEKHIYAAGIWRPVRILAQTP